MKHVHPNVINVCGILLENKTIKLAKKKTIKLAKTVDQEPNL